MMSADRFLMPNVGFIHGNCTLEDLCVQGLGAGLGLRPSLLLRVYILDQELKIHHKLRLES